MIFCHVVLGAFHFPMRCADDCSSNMDGCYILHIMLRNVADTSSREYSGLLHSPCNVEECYRYFLQGCYILHVMLRNVTDTSSREYSGLLLYFLYTILMIALYIQVFPQWYMYTFGATSFIPQYPTPGSSNIPLKGLVIFVSIP